MLMTLREYAYEKLFDTGEVENIRARHLRYFIDLAERAQPLLRGPHVRDWRDRLERDNDNIRAALQWSLRSDQASDGLRLAGALEDFWRIGGHLTEGRQWLGAVLSAAPADRSSARARALFGAGRLAWAQGEFAPATELMETALEIFRYLGDKWGIARSMMEIAFHSMARNEVDRAASLAQESLLLSREIGDDYSSPQKVSKSSLGLFQQLRPRKIERSNIYPKCSNSTAIWAENKAGTHAGNLELQ